MSTFAQTARSIIQNSCSQNLGTLPRKNLQWSPLFREVTGCRPVTLLKRFTKKLYSDDDVTPGIIRNSPKIFGTTQNNSF